MLLSAAGWWAGYHPELRTSGLPDDMTIDKNVCVIYQLTDLGRLPPTADRHTGTTTLTTAGQERASIERAGEGTPTMSTNVGDHSGLVAKPKSQRTSETPRSNGTRSGRSSSTAELMPLIPEHDFALETSRQAPERLLEEYAKQKQLLESLVCTVTRFRAEVKTHA